MALNILIVDDSAVMRQMILKTVTLSGVPLGEVHQAANGQEGLGVLDSHWIDLALVDYLLPDHDGLVVSSQLRKTHPALQIIIMTGEKLSPGEEERCLRDGRVMIQKPFLMEDLMELVRARLPKPAAAAGQS